MKILDYLKSCYLVLKNKSYSVSKILASIEEIYLKIIKRVRKKNETYRNESSPHENSFNF